MTQKKTHRYGSRASNYYVCVQAREPEYLPGTATIVGYKQEILAEFGVAGGEYTVLDKNGDPLLDDGTGLPVGKTADIRGHYFDSRAQQEDKGWSDEIHDRVVARLNFLCNSSVHSGDIWRLEDALLEAPLPGWDALSAARKVAIATELGIVGAALAYETQQDSASEVVERLQGKASAKAAVEREQEEALVA